MLTKPVALFIFRRPDTTARVFDQVRAAAPQRLFVVADGPRTAAENGLCSATRAVTERVTWDCEVCRLYADKNLGCGRRVSSGLDWVFSQAEEAIILEDDCVADMTFFRFCGELLDYYRHEPRVTMISGTSFVPDAAQMGRSYQFSRYALMWGWATWARAWRSYDFRMTDWPRMRDSGWAETFFRSSKEATYWRETLDATASGAVDTWDYQWMFACWLSGGLGVIPNGNLVTNVGFDLRATHTTGSSNLANVPSKRLDFPLLHPGAIEADEFTESRIFKQVFVPGRTPLSVLRAIKHRSRQLLSRATTPSAGPVGAG